MASRAAALALSPALALGCARDTASDVLILRSGEARQGTLTACAAEACTLDRTAIPRNTIEWIGLASRPPVPAVRDPTVDEAHARSGAVTPGKLVEIDASMVTLDGTKLARREVSWVHLAGRPTPVAPVAKFHGVFTWSAHQGVPSGPQTWDGRADLVLSDDGQGHLTGSLKGTQVQLLNIARCQAETHGTVAADLGGTISGEKITVRVLQATADWPDSAACRGGGTARTGTTVLQWPHLDEAFAGLAPDGAGNYVFDRTWQLPHATTLYYTVRLTRGK